MTSQEHKQLASEIAKAAKDVSKSSSKAKKLLEQAGICDKSGNLKEPYQ